MNTLCAEYTPSNMLNVNIEPTDTQLVVVVHRQRWIVPLHQLSNGLNIGNVDG